ncbi:HAAS signaling domain-containing protein [Georgenia yuyongxinii]
MQADGLVAAYLDDLGRMLGPVDPGLRADVLGGVREHIEAVLGARPWRPAEVEQVLLELGPPEAVAAAALEDERRDGPGVASTGAGWPGPTWPAADGVPQAPGARAARAPAPALARTWVPPTVGLLLLVVAALYLVVLAAAVAFSAATTTAEVPADLSGGGFHGPADEDFASPSPLRPASYDVVWSMLVPLPVAGVPWLVAMILLAGSPLWSIRQKWAGAALLPGLLLANGATAAAAALAPAGTARAVVLVGLLLVVAAGSVAVIVRIWRDGARRARDIEPARWHTTASPGWGATEPAGSYPAGSYPAGSYPAPAGSGWAPAAPGPVLTRQWVPPLVVVLLVLGMLLLLSPLGLMVGPGVQLGMPGPTAVLLTISALTLLAPLWLVGAVLVTISPLWHGSEKLAVWLMVPGTAAVLSFAGHVAGLTDACTSRRTTSCGAVDAGAWGVALVLALVLVLAALTAVIVRVARTGAERARELQTVAGAEAGRPGAAGTGRAGRWWAPVAVAVTLGIAVMATAAVPAILAGHTYTGGLNGVRGYLVWTGGREAVLTGLVWVVPVWLGAVLLLARSRLWGRGAVAVGALLAPVLLAGGLLATSGDVLSPGRHALLPVTSAGLGVLGALVVAWLWASGARAVHRPAEAARAADQPHDAMAG